MKGASSPDAPAPHESSTFLPLEASMHHRPPIRVRATSWGIAALLVAIVPGFSEAQQRFPLAPNPSTGLTVSPFFEGWYANPDGTYSLSLGYFNRNSRETIHIPRGPNNFIEPAEFDGFQPEHFAPRRVRGVFTVTIPGEFAASGQRVVWTLIHRGDTLLVPAGPGVPAYEMGYEPMAMGSTPPALRFESGGEAGYGPMGIVSRVHRTTSVGAPLTLRLFAHDESQRVDGELVPINVGWVTHQGPAEATFSDEAMTEEPGGGEASVTVTFPEPGEYVLRAQADNFDARDSSSGDQCCWTNGYVRVTVTP